MSYAASWRKNLAFFRLAAISQLEYRFNFFLDAVFQPFLSAGIEVLLWYAVFYSIGTPEVGGFTREYYLSYALWGAFVARVTANWMYEFRMIEEIETGSVNSVLTRPMTFFEYYLFQFIGYKILTSAASLGIPLLLSAWIHGSQDLTRIPESLGLMLLYLVFLHLVSFSTACLAFFLNRVHSFTVAKNLAFWLLSGELFPLDLLPEPGKSILLSLPFSSAVYVPTGYLTGRIGMEALWRGYANVVIGILVLAPIAAWIWHQGRRTYSGTGA